MSGKAEANYNAANPSISFGQIFRDSEANYAGKGGTKKITTGYSLSDANVGVSMTKDVVKDSRTNEVLSTNEETAIGVTPFPIIPVNMSVSHSVQQDMKSDQTTYTGKAYLGAGGTVGAGTVLQLDVQIGLRISYKTKER